MHETGAELDKQFDPQACESRWYRQWEARGYFAPQGAGAPYCIMLPPPNVTGTLHMGHAFQDTLMDTLTRYHRMAGDRTLWQPGTDHAGIATQMVVERQLEAGGQSRHDLGRANFVQRVWQWRAESGGTIVRQMRRLGASCDWSRERFTLDEPLSRAVTEVFVRLYEEGLIYRGKRLVNWDPVLRTAVSDLEVLSEEEDGFLWHLRYPLADGSGHLVVATTRPETLLGDAAVAVHPEDERYCHLIGRQVKLPLTGREIPIIADDYVDPAFGTGCVKITPAHDFNDYAVGQRHHLPLINVFTEDAHLNDNAPADYRGLDRFEVRQRIVADLEAQGLLEKIAPHKLMVPRGDRSKAVIEPYLTDQWYVKIQPLAEPAIRAVEDGRIRFVPENWSKTYFDWMHRIEDWCISRQLWWGHQIPAWYGPDGQVFVARHEDEAQARAAAHYGTPVPLERDHDVLDTWFSSALWPFTTLGWPEDTPELRTFYPTSVLVTGFDIIFFWVARMIMMGLKFTGEVPFREVYIHGLVRDAEGQKMSKSKGNVLDPIDLIDGIELESLVQKRTSNMMNPQAAGKIEKATRKEFPDGIPAFGADALRFTFASLATQGRDIKFDLNRIEGYRNFCNKLWNASRYVLMQLPAGEDVNAGAAELSLVDRWIISRLQETEATVREAFDGYRFSDAANALYQFIWGDYCDWYIELTKPVLTGDFSPELQRGARRTLVRVLEASLRLLHPIMPFITEEIWQKVAGPAGKQGDTIMLAPYPMPDATRIDRDAAAETEWLMACVRAVRTIRGEMDIAPGRPLDLLLQGGGELDRARVERHRPWLERLARLQSITWLAPDAAPPPAALELVGELKLMVPLAGLIDVGAEQARIDKEVNRVQADLARVEGKLANPSFVDRAPAEIVAKERAKAEELRQALEELTAQRQRLQALA
ncbi:valine--tRNA ligase [Thermithiobacillus tepidarius DSM 3134]|uniref:valine--tRNA ligase n=1 Tax=Thermithiobacillus tepidarius TaxID=929 RepID=UPI00040667FA|nr:valine--tRNA ligase [Thermithiobacillus tepidarius]